MESILYSFLAILALSFLVFIHELGHYFMAIREGMRVEAFAIGFGKPIFTWVRNGVKWMICILPFGGYVRIAGMQKEGDKEPYEIPDGFFGKKPMQRIRVALAGPLVNIVFAFLLFSFLWVTGGREKPFAEFTHRIGWVDPHSTLYEKGVRPGDLIDQYGGAPYNGFRDLLVASLMKGETIQIQGEKINEVTGEKTPFDYTLPSYPNPLVASPKFRTIGVLAPASYLIYTASAGYSNVAESSIELGDRVVWADGERIFSVQQLSSLVNQSTALVTIEREGKRSLQKVARIRLDDVKMTSYEKAEVGDWQYEAGIKGKLQDLSFIPYSLSPTGVVERKLGFVDPQTQVAVADGLQEGDKIIAIDGVRITSSYQLLEALQTRRVLTIVERNPTQQMVHSWRKADAQFDRLSLNALNQLIAGIGQKELLSQEGDLHLLRPIVPTFKGNRYILGLGLSDREVIYNPTPFQQFGSVTVETWRTLTALFSGTLNPKYVSGPVGIVHMVHQSWMVGVKEVLFWLALISLNLGLVNLLPIPVLDGGHIMISIAEAIRRKPFAARTMERLIIPFVALLVVFFLYITYQDLSRLFSKFF
ncbi:MAG TPA: site-2 protease family protein [Chlamydiales bacterium]|nr:MAG: hypothetical protein A3F67_08590 [Verrucomicrobia bacterium RIFCSPHIGHO2_12_FULL_41_10]HLB53372.1 site-2 protease family protein [Chlamydiales bacterium]